MRMTFRWYGEGNDSVSLKHIRQIPGMEGIVWALHDVPVGEEWPMDKILEVKRQAEEYGLNTDVVESVNIHEDIKLGLPSREVYIENYKKTLEKLASVGVKVVCYNFMPVFDWTRSDMFKALPDESTALFYEKAKIENIDPLELISAVQKEAKGLTLPGWEPEKMARIKDLFKAYESVSEEDLWANLKYFLEQIIPVAEANDIKMAIHPDDPPWSIFGLPRIINSEENLARFLSLVDNPYNGLTLCSGSLGPNPCNDIPKIIRRFGDRIHFAHIRNLKVYENGDFIETSHLSRDGSLDIVEIVKAYHDIGFTGYTRPDHGRHIWDEVCRPGYGLYDRALGVMHILGIWEAFEKLKNEGAN